ncbi:MAG: hypothetical protein K8S98_09785 [Planctomycetes bacterium]|nr:hypothetical protein [Planctomycetota bacterium]
MIVLARIVGAWLVATSAGLALAQTPQAPTNRFPVIVYRQAYAGREAPRDLIAPFGGVHVRGDEAAGWVLARGLDFYVEHSAGRDDLHLDRDRATPRGSADERDPRLLVREPCLTDPKTRERLFATLDRTLAARGGRAGLGYSLGDEVSLTSGGAPEDLCLSPTCREAWRTWLRERGLFERAHAAGFDDLAAVSTDAALAALASDEHGQVEFWLLRRAFHHDIVVALLTELAARVRAQRPEARVGLMGLSGETAFGNVAVERALGFLDFVECYRTFDASDLAFTLRGPKQAVYATVFPSARAPAAWAWATSEHWLRGGDGLVVWSDRELERSKPLFDSLARAVALVRRLDGELASARPTPHGVAVLESSRNLAWCWLQDARDDGATWPKRMASWQADHGRFELGERAWLELLEDAGTLPGVLPLDIVDASSVTRFPLLVASELAALDDAQLARLERYLAAGGRLLVDGEFAAVDGAGRARGADVRAALAEKFPGRVLGAPRGVANYLALRSEETRAALGGMLAVAGVERAPFTPRATKSDVRWLVAWSDDAQGRTLCVALPKFPGVGREAGLGSRSPAPKLDDLEVAVEANTGRALEWLHPSADAAGHRTLVAGEPLVVRLAPRAQ